MKITTRSILLAALAGIAVAILIKTAPLATKQIRPSDEARKMTSLPRPSPAVPGPAPEQMTEHLPITPPPRVPSDAVQTAPATPAQSRPPTPQKSEIRDPVARLALNDVGLDPNAEAYWFQAINDPSLPAEERKDLIEDLNETGLSDPDHPSPQDLVLIASRIEIIEQLAPYAVDQVNADAFSEAYKDLVKLSSGLPAD